MGCPFSPPRPPAAGLLNWLPSFFKDAYHVEISQLASFTLLPYVVQGSVGVVAGQGGGHAAAGRLGMQSCLGDHDRMRCLAWLLP